MTELDEDVQRRLVDAYRSTGPSAPERERMLAALNSAIATGTSAPVAAASKGMLKSFMLSHPVALSGLGLGVGCAVALGVWLSLAPAPPATPPLCAAPCVPVRASASVSLPEAPPATKPDSDAPGPASAPSTASEVVGGSPTTSHPPSGKRPVANGSDLAAEAALLHQAHSSYRRGQPAETLALLREHSAKYPSSQLSVERGTLKVLALCALNRIDEARRIAATLPPRSPALRGTCAER